MRRLACLLAFVGMMSIVSAALAQTSMLPSSKSQDLGAVARASNAPSESDYVDPALAFGASVGSAVAVVSDREPWTSRLEQNGHEGVPSMLGEFGVRFSLYVHGFEISFMPAGLLRTSSEEYGTSISGTSLMTEITYDAFRRQLFTLGPSIGAGWYQSNVCMQSGPTAQAPTDGTFFHQIVSNPGKESCLEANSFVVRGGLVAGLVIPTPFLGFDGTGFLNLRPTVAWPVSSSDYTVAGQGQFGSFEGPAPPHPSFALSLELGFILGSGQRSAL